MPERKRKEAPAGLGRPLFFKGSLYFTRWGGGMMRPSLRAALSGKLRAFSKSRCRLSHFCVAAGFEQRGFGNFCNAILGMLTTRFRDKSPDISFDISALVFAFGGRILRSRPFFRRRQRTKKSAGHPIRDRTAAAPERRRNLRRAALGQRPGPNLRCKAAPLPRFSLSLRFFADRRLKVWVRKRGARQLP